MEDNTMGPGNYPTLPSKQGLNQTPNQISFTSISSNDSGQDPANTSEDTVDAIPLRIHRMPLLSKNYVQQRQASVENLLSGGTPTLPSRIINQPEDEKSYIEYDENASSICPPSGDEIKITPDPNPYSYFEVHSKTGEVAFLNGHTKSNKPAPSSYLRYNAEQSTQLAGSSQTNDTGRSFSSNTNCPTRGEDEVDVALRRQPRPHLGGMDEVKVNNHMEEEEAPRPIISTPPRKPAEMEMPGKPPGCCEKSCMKVSCALFNWKYLCDRFSITDFLMTFVTIGIYIFDIVTDLLLALSYYHKIVNHEDYIVFFRLTLSLVIAPSFVVQCFSYFWVYDDFRYKKNREEEQTGSRKVTLKDIAKLAFTLILHIFQFAVFFRYVRVLIYGIKSRYYEVKGGRKNSNEVLRKHFVTLWRYEVQDISMLRLLESFLEAAPQLVLQIYIMLMTKQVDLIPVISCIASLLALSSMMVTIQRAIRNSNEMKKQLSIPASVIMFIWRAFTISSRVLVFSLFLTISPLAFFVFILLHWFIATMWIAGKGTNYCTKQIAEYLFDAICGLIYVFCFFNVHEEKDGKSSRSRWRMLIFYSVVYVENSVLSIVWYLFRPGGDTASLSFSDLYDGILQRNNGPITTTPALVPTKNTGVIPTTYAVGIIVAVHGFFIVGLTFMAVYYAFLHPKRSNVICCCVEPKKQRRSSADEGPTKLVSAPAERIPQIKTRDRPPSEPSGALLLASAAPHDPTSYKSSDVQIGPNQSLRKLRKEQDTSVRQRERRFSDGENSDTDVSSLEDMWSKTVFNRGKRAKKLYTRQYSREKILENNEGGHAELLGESPRRTDRFKATVTPVQERGSYSKQQTGHCETTRYPVAPEQKKYPKPVAQPLTPSVVIKPGSQTLKPTMAPRSATHQGLQSHTLGSPNRKEIKFTPPSSLHTSPVKQYPGMHKKTLKSAPRPVETRGYSASMSCLVEDKPLSYAARRKQALNREVPRTSSFTLKNNEVVECMESSV